MQGYCEQVCYGRREIGTELEFAVLVVCFCIRVCGKDVVKAASYQGRASIWVLMSAPCER